LLPLKCDEEPELRVIHPLQYLDLADDAIHDATEGDDNMAMIDRYSFDIADLAGKHLFGIKQAPRSHSRKLGICFGGDYVSEELKRVFAANGLQGVVFKKVFSYLRQ
jgi:hypothetical protein